MEETPHMDYKHPHRPSNAPVLLPPAGLEGLRRLEAQNKVRVQHALSHVTLRDRGVFVTARSPPGPARTQNEGQRGSGRRAEERESCISRSMYLQGHR